MWSAPRSGYARPMQGTTEAATRERLVRLPPAGGQDTSGLKLRLEGAKLRPDTILEDLQQLVRERPLEEPRRFLRRKR